MKRYVLLLFSFALTHLSFTQNVGIGTPIPADKLTVLTPSGNFGISHTDGTVTVGSYISSSTGWLGTKSNHPLSFYTNNSIQQLTLATNGNFGVGITGPQAKLHVAGNVKIDAANTIEFGAGVAGKEENAGKIGYRVFGSFDALDIVGAGATSIARKITFWNEGGAQFTGSVGIGIANPANRLQIGSMGAAGFNGNDIAIGNGTEALGIAQTATTSQFASSTNIALLPRINGGEPGRVGINTSTPRAPLDVVNSVSTFNPNSNADFSYFTLSYNFNIPFEAIGAVDNSSTVPNVSIIASDRILATEFNAYSDVRIKDIVGVSNTVSDLQTINKIKITDYTLKDKVKNGNQTFKKVIAQEVEEVYPQVVSKHTDFIPNVYQLVAKVQKVPNGHRLYFDKDHNLTKESKRLQLIVPGNSDMQQYNIVVIPNGKDVIIEGMTLQSDKIFVYGEEVNDFRSVDYEGLTTLNISATQELSKLVKQQQAAIDLLTIEIRLLKEMMCTRIQ